MTVRRVLFIGSFFYVVIAVACAIASVFVSPGLRIEQSVGCVWEDALITWVHCQGFLGSSAVAGLLNFPLLLMYAPMYAFVSGTPIYILAGVLVTLAVWAPVIYFIVRLALHKPGQW